MTSAPTEDIEEEHPTQEDFEDTAPPYPSIARYPPRQYPEPPASNGIVSPTNIYTNAITISIPSFSLPYFIYLWETFLVQVRLRIAPTLLRRSVVFYCVLFLMLQLLLMVYYQRRASTQGPNAFIRGRRVEPDFEYFVNQRKDRTNTTTVLFADNQNKEWVHNFMHDLKHMQMSNSIIFARDHQVCSEGEGRGMEALKTI
jgi:hypothetical protein